MQFGCSFLWAYAKRTAPLNACAVGLSSKNGGEWKFTEWDSMFESRFIAFKSFFFYLTYHKICLSGALLLGMRTIVGTAVCRKTLNFELLSANQNAEFHIWKQGLVLNFWCADKIKNWTFFILNLEFLSYYAVFEATNVIYWKIRYISLHMYRNFQILKTLLKKSAI